MQQPPQFNQQPPPYYNQQPPPVYYVQPQPQPQQSKSAIKTMAIILLIGSLMVFIFGLCTLPFGGLGILFIIMAIAMFIGGLVALAFT